MNIVEAIKDPNLFRSIFKDLSTWEAWIVLLKALFAIEMTPTELEVFKACTGRTRPPDKPVREAFLVIGRRGGKSRIASLLAVFLSCFGDYGSLAPGEKAVAMVVSADRRQSRVVFRYVSGIFDNIPMLKSLIERQTAESIDLTNNTSIEIHTASFRSLRGYSVCLMVGDEIAFWRSEESLNPDFEIVNAARFGMSNIANPLLLCISSPYARRGVLWDAYKKFYGQESDRTLVWVADTQTMNPTVDPEIIRAAYEQDESVASAEFGAQFRRDIESFVGPEVVESCVMAGRRELPYLSGHSYAGFCDPSGGSQDSMTLGVAHKEENRIILDAVRERRAPFSPEDVIKEFVETLKSYKINRVQGDRYGGEWPRERFRVHGIDYQICEKVKSELYQNLLPLLNANTIQLLDIPRLSMQICNLERRTGRSGKDTIDHSPNSNDDLVNCVAGVAAMVNQTQMPGFFFA